MDLGHSHGVATTCQTTLGRRSSEGNPCGPCPPRASSPGSSGSAWGGQRQVIVMHPEGFHGNWKTSPEPGLWGSIEEEGAPKSRPEEEGGVISSARGTQGGRALLHMAAQQGQAPAGPASPHLRERTTRPSGVADGDWLGWCPCGRHQPLSSLVGE